MVAREPGESEADYELRRRDHRQSRSRCIVSSTSEEEEEKKEESEEETQAAGSAAGSGLGAVDSTAPEVEEEVKEKEEEKEIGKRAPKTKETRGKGPKPGATPSPKPKTDPSRNYLQVETRRPAVSPGGTERPAVTLVGSTDREPSHTFEVRGLSTPRQPSEPVESAPWRKSTLKEEHGKGFRLRSSQSRQYRRLQDLVRQARKEGANVPRHVEKQVKEFGPGRAKTFKRKGTKRPIRSQGIQFSRGQCQGETKPRPRRRLRLESRSSLLFRQRTQQP